MDGGDDGGARERRDKMAAIARSLEQAFEGHGFALLVFDKTPRDGRVSYVSNCGRGDMLEAMRRLIAEYGAAPTLAAADREKLADLARRAATRPVDPRLFGHPVAGPEALRALEALRVTVAGLVVAFSHDLTPPAWEPVRHLSVSAPDGSAPDPGLLRAIAREFGMEGCRFTAAPPPHGGKALHAFQPMREAPAAAAAADAAPAASAPLDPLRSMDWTREGSGGTGALAAPRQRKSRLRGRRGGTPSGGGLPDPGSGRRTSSARPSARSGPRGVGAVDRATARRAGRSGRSACGRSGA